MKFSVVSIFPDFFRQSAHGNFLRAWKEGRFQIELINPRSFTQDVHQSVDDRPFGGGDGMILKPGPLAAAIDHAESQGGEANARVVYLSPQGKPLNQETLDRLMKHPHLILVCGRYGGLDERVLRTRVDEEISLGDFVLSGGEIAALALMDAMSRFIPG
ncbi:MAG: tRNA (guanosine(37)-N1)-methyltransferase TrmD, partial [Bdellovibrio sp.]